MRGVKFNYMCVHSLCDSQPLIGCINEHWLHSFDQNFLASIHSDYFVSSSVPNTETSSYMFSSTIRGHGGVAILWHKSFDNFVVPIRSPRSDRLIGVRIRCQPVDLVIFSVYLPTRSGCTSLFTEVMDLLDSCFTLVPDAVIIFAGDFNADPGLAGGPFSPTSVNEQGRILKRYLARWSYVSAHLQFPSASHHTYESEAHHSLSTIDHILCPRYFLHHIIFACTIDSPLNFSGHLPVTSSFRVLMHPPTFHFDRPSPSCNPSYNPTPPCNSQNRPLCWSKLDDNAIQDLYSTVVAKRLQCLSDIPISSPEDIELVYNSFTHILCTTAAQVIPVASHQRCKPKWPLYLSQSHNLSKRYYREWCHLGKPSSPTNPVKRKYKDAKRVFRREFRRYQLHQHNEFISSLDPSSRNIFVSLRSLLKCNSSPTNSLHYSGRSFVGEDILHGWAEYFESLGSPASLYQPDIDFLQASLEGCCNLPIQFSEEEVLMAIKALPLHKAPGPDAVSSEHLYFAAESCASILRRLFNSMISNHYIPHILCKSIIIPIYKGHDKPANNPASYRGISLSSIVSKLFEKLIFIYLDDSISPLLHPLQGGFRSGVSSLHTSYIFQEAVTECRRKKKKAYICLLDAHKAFDTVSHKGLFIKLLQTGIPRDIFLSLLYWYSNLSSCVRWNSHISHYFPIKQGVRQGAVLSPLLYSLYINDLLFQLETVPEPLHIDNIFCGAPTYADDIALIACSPSTLQNMIDIAADYAKKWLYSFGIDKSVIIVLGESSAYRTKARLHRQWFLSGSPLREVDFAKHLGIILSVNSPHITLASALISSFRSCFYGLSTICTRFTTLNPCVSLFLLKSFCLPLLCFGFEIWSPPKSVILLLDRALNKALRTIIGVPTHAPVFGIHLLLGTIPVDFLLKYRRLSFLISTLHLPPTAPSVQILLHRLQSDDPSTLIRSISDDLESLSLPSIDELVSTLPSKAAWKSHVKLSLYFLFFNCNSNIPHIPPKLVDAIQLIPHKPQNYSRPSVILSFFAKSHHLSLLLCNRIRLLLHCSDLYGHTYMFNNSTHSATCKLCLTSDESSYHYLMECISFSYIRCKWFAIINHDNLPDHALYSRLIGVNWVDDYAIQEAILLFIADLRAHRAILLTSS